MVTVIPNVSPLAVVLGAAKCLVALAGQVLVASLPIFALCHKEETDQSGRLLCLSYK